MKPLLVITITIIAGLSCKKSDVGSKVVAVDYLSFGKAYGYCVGDCAQFFKLEEEKIYADSATRYTGAGSIVFNTNFLPNDKYLFAKELKENFPAYLYNSSNQTYGCPDCVDQGGVHLEVKKNGVTKYWHIDMDTNRQPVEIRQYVERVLAILSQL